MTWAQLRRQFQRRVAKQGAKEVAKQIPADKATVYRLVNGATRKPSKAVEAAIAKLVKESEQ